MRRVVISVEVETCLAVRELREIAFIAFGIKPMRRTTIRQVMPDGINHDCRGTIEQVQVNAIKPEPEMRSQRARMARFAKEDAERADPKRPGWFSDRIAEVQSKPERKAKRAKGAK